MAVKTCPRCELRFELLAEVADHLARGHGVEVQTPAGAELFGSSRKRG